MSDEVFARAIDAMSDVQRRSVEAAGALVERLIASVDGNHSASAEPDDNDAPRPATDAEDALAGFAKLWRDSITSLAAAVSDKSDTAPRIDATAGPTPSPVRIEVDPTTCGGTAEVWLHNPGSDALDKLRVHWGAPQSHDGSTLDPLSIVADPDAFDLPARASRGVTITINVADAAPGTYRTMLLVDGLPDQWLPVEIVVPDTR
ncbi:MAG: hypothetical protein QOF21_2355 [Actinomycetota bacterium]|jgi:hypothetical protein